MRGRIRVKPQKAYMPALARLKANQEYLVFHLQISLENTSTKWKTAATRRAYYLGTLEQIGRSLEVY